MRLPWSNARLLLQIAQFQEKANQQINIIKTEKSQLEQLLNNFPLYEEKHREIEDLSNKIAKLTKQKSDIELLQELNDKHSLLTEQLDTRRVTFNKLQSREKHFADFAKQMKTKSEYSEQLTGLRKNLTNNEQAFKNNDAVLVELESQKVAFLNKNEKLEAQKNNASKHFAEITRIEEIIRQQNSARLATRSVELDKNIDDLKLQGVEVKKFTVDELDEIVASKFSNEILLRITKEYSEAIEQIQLLNTQQVELNNLLDAANQQQESISTLIKLGSRLINHNQDEYCPLCQHGHESFAALADAVNSNSSLSDSQQRLLKEIEACQTQIKQKNDKLNRLKEDFSTQQTSHLDNLREQLHELIQEKKSISATLNQLDKDNIEVNRLKGASFHKNQALFQSDIDDEITKNTEANAVIEIQIDKAREESKKLAEEAQKLKVEFVATTSKFENGNEALAEYLVFLVEMQVPNEVIEPKFDELALKEIIANRLNVAMNSFYEKQQEVKDNDEVLNTIKMQYSVSFIENAVDNIDEYFIDITKSSEQLVLSNKLLYEFYTMNEQLGQEHLLEDNNWATLKRMFIRKISDLHSLKTQNTELISKLTSLTTLAEQVLKYINYIKSTDELQKNELEIKKYDGIKEALLTDLVGIN